MNAEGDDSIGLLIKGAYFAVDAVELTDRWTHRALRPSERGWGFCGVLKARYGRDREIDPIIAPASFPDLRSFQRNYLRWELRLRVEGEVRTLIAHDASG